MTHNVGNILVHTVDSSKSNIILVSIDNNAHHLHDIIGRSSTEDFIKYVEVNMIRNCNVTRQDILHAKEIFEINLISIKRKKQDLLHNMLN